MRCGESRGHHAGLLVRLIRRRRGGETGHVARGGAGDVADGATRSSCIRERKEGAGRARLAGAGEVAFVLGIAIEPEELVL